MPDDELEFGIGELGEVEKPLCQGIKSKLLGVGIGTVGTAAIQSSGATTVMTIGFVNPSSPGLRTSSFS